MKCTMVLLAALCIAVSAASGAIVPLQQESLDDLLGPGYVPVGAFVTTPVSDGLQQSNMFSQAFTDGSGLYAYLYQVENTSPIGYQPIQLFTLFPFTGINTNVIMGTLTGNIPAGFWAGASQEPLNVGYVDMLLGGPEISFYYSSMFGKSIQPGAFSEVMFVMSNLAPGTTTGVAVAGGKVVGPVPEPATMLLLVGGTALLGLKRRR